MKTLLFVQTFDAMRTFGEELALSVERDIDSNPAQWFTPNLAKARRAELVSRLLLELVAAGVCSNRDEHSGVSRDLALEMAELIHDWRRHPLGPVASNDAAFVVEFVRPLVERTDAFLAAHPELSKPSVGDEKVGG